MAPHPCVIDREEAPVGLGVRPNRSLDLIAQMGPMWEARSTTLSVSLCPPTLWAYFAVSDVVLATPTVWKVESVVSLRTAVRMGVEGQRPGLRKQYLLLEHGVGHVRLGFSTCKNMGELGLRADCVGFPYREETCSLTSVGLQCLLGLGRELELVMDQARLDHRT